MDISQIEKLSETVWRIPAVKPMRVPALIYGGESLVRDMDEKVAEPLRNVAALPGIVRAAYAMPDAHGFRSSPQTPKAGDGHARLGQYLEVQEVTKIFDNAAASAFGLKKEECVVSIHCGSRGLGHQVGPSSCARWRLRPKRVGGLFRIVSSHTPPLNRISASVILARCDAPSTAREGRGIIVKSPSQRGVAEEALGAYKDVGAVVEATELAGLAKKVARLAPMICIKG